MRSANTCPSSRIRRGFNLIEAAIVLGVVGLVIGGIWVAASAVRENLKIRDTISGILSISVNLRNIITARDSNSLGDVVSLNQLAINAGFIPEGWRSSGTQIYHPFNNQVFLVNYANPSRFDFGIMNLSNSACSQLAAAINQRIGVDNDLFPGHKLRIFSDGIEVVTASSLPINLTGNECGITNHIYLNFSFNKN